MTKKCKSCKTEIDAKATKCPHCQTDQRNWFRRHPVITGILVLFLIGIIGGAANSGSKNSSSSSNSTTTSATQAQSQQQNQPTPTTDPHPHFGDGTFVVGKDIQPGTYRTREAASGCYFERMSGFGG